MKNKTILGIIVVLALLGVADSLYALNQHYEPADSSSCDVNETISCTEVNQSEYSEIDGVPVAGLGAAGYMFLAVLSAGMLSGFMRQSTALPVLLVTSAAALGFSAWLTYVEIAILGAVCPLCVISLVLIIAISCLAAAAEVRRRRPVAG